MSIPLQLCYIVNSAEFHINDKKRYTNNNSMKGSCKNVALGQACGRNFKLSNCQNDEITDSPVELKKLRCTVKPMFTTNKRAHQMLLQLSYLQRVQQTPRMKHSVTSSHKDETHTYIYIYICLVRPRNNYILFLFPVRGSFNRLNS